MNIHIIARVYFNFHSYYFDNVKLNNLIEFR